jgi:HD-GYP domain-containing protein (c-di-GMP phosphodiesterase class II)
LSPKDIEHIMTHPIVGKQILSTMSEFKDILDVIYHHHERIDGKGYPNGLKQRDIPLLSRILAVADAYDAMRSERPYRKAKTKDQAVHELRQVKGSQLDEKIVAAFVNILAP